MICGIIQARMGSTRLPGKVLLPLGNATVLDQVIRRAKDIVGVDTWALTTTKLDEDDPLAEIGEKHGLAISRSPAGDVLNRYYNAANILGADTVVRITADCPLLDPGVSSRVVALFKRSKCDYVSNVHPPTYPDGLDTEVFTMDSLCKAWTHGRGMERDHVTPYIWRRPHQFRMSTLVCATDWSAQRWTLDTKEDYEFITRVYASLWDPKFEDIIQLPFRRTLPRVPVL